MYIQCKQDLKIAETQEHNTLACQKNTNASTFKLQGTYSSENSCAILQKKW